MFHSSVCCQSPSGPLRGWPLGLLLVPILCASCRSFVDQHDPTSERSTSSEAQAALLATTPTWRRWPGESDQAVEETKAPAAKDGDRSPQPSPAQAGELPSQEDSPAVALEKNSSELPAAVDKFLEKEIDGDAQQTDGWYRHVEVSDREPIRDGYRWRNDRLETLLGAAEDRRDKLTRMLKADDALSSATAAIGLYRLGDNSLEPLLVKIVQHAKLSLRIRQAAIESLALAEGSSTRSVLENLLQQYGQFATDEKSSYVSALHAELVRGLCRHVAPHEDSRFIEALSSPDHGVRITTLEVWSSATESSLPAEAVALLDDARANVRIAALKAVAAHRHGAALPHVRRLTKDHEVTVRLESIRVLGELGGQESRLALLEMLKNEPERFRIAAVNALARAGDMTTVYAVATDPSWHLRREVATALAIDSSARSREIARTLLADRSVEVRLKMVESLAKWPLEAAGPLLLEAADSDARRIQMLATNQLAQRWEAAKALATLTSPENRRELLASLQKQWTAEHVTTSPATWTSKAQNSVASGNAGPAEMEIPQEQLAETETLLREYLESETGERPAELRQRLMQRGPAVLVAYEQLVLDRQQPLEDAVFHDLLAPLDQHLAAIEQLRAENVKQRRRAAETLAKLADDQPLRRLALERLATLALADSDTDVSRWLLKVIHPHDTEPAHRIAYAAVSHPSADIRRRACEYLQLHAASRHEAKLMPLLEDADISVVRAAVRALGACGSLSDVGPVKRLLMAKDTTLRVEAAVALAKVGSSSGPAALERLSFDQNEKVRQQIATAIGELGDAVYIPTLIRLLDDRSSVRRAALNALSKVAEDPFASAADADRNDPETMAQFWRDWYGQQGRVIQFE